MISPRKVRVNRANARASTGPRTAAGKAQSARNARRHGLSVLVLSDPNLSAEVEALARDIARVDASPEIVELSRRIAEAQIDLIRARRARHDLLANALSDSDYVPQKGVVKRVRTMERVPGLLDSPQPVPAELASMPVVAEGPAKFALIISDLAHQLTMMDRYERRALSRRKFAIRALDVAIAGRLGVA